MEVTPEIYAWLTSLNIIDPFKSLSEDLNNNFIIPEKTLNLFFGGKYMDIILNKLQEAYNQFYKIKLDYISTISQLKPIEDNQEYISNSIKYANWTIINEILAHFGLTYSEEEINLIVSNNKEQLYKIIENIYELLNQLLKHSIDSSSNNINNSSSIKLKPTRKHIISSSNQRYQQSKDTKIETAELNYQTNNKNNINNRYNESKNSNNTKITISKEKALNINDLDSFKSYKDCNSALEFFIVSICKNMHLKPRQSVALLSNNRKYLSIICNKGYNNQYSIIKNWLTDIIKNWLTDLYNNKDLMAKFIQESEEGPNICYGTIGTAM